MMKSPCTCNILARYAKDPLVPVIEQNGNFLLGDGTIPDPRLTIQYCTFCGEMGWPDRGSRDCECGVMGSIVRDVPILMEFDAQMNEFHILSPKGSSRYRIYYCIACGGNPPASLRSTFFEDTSEEEFEEARMRYAALRDETDFERELGPPVDVCELPPLPDQLLEIYGIEPVVKQWRFEPQGSKISYCLQWMRDGSYQKSLSSKHKNGKRE